ncbi:glycoside hydrolase family 65 protein [Listeria booriae]|uniref:Glycoside hydrolase family 65 protein n=1 Tax=Listeria booriae TaxID=1552123 RepID=A0A7X0XB08_9LIST|nr:glycoside hydrolase family 65 protein [Listeria booriae]MBC1503816.1 glycoside hydrolase family 65 protein [Listeria booriae]MBC1524767.1 glycoside hydrolase family 65 protein [Listeria booriae]MBC1530475.1 glycoside hydrolase family 65 protein [Listeria booriae]
MQRLFEIDEWKLKSKQVEKDAKRLQESLTSLGNGYMGMRGNFEERYSGDTHQGTYIAGVWYPDKTRVGWWKNGYPDYFGKVINALNFIGIDVTIDGETLDLFVDETADFALELDMETGILRRSFQVKKNGKSFLVETERFLSIVKQELCLIRYHVKALDAEAEIVLTPYVDGNVTNEDANYDEMFWLEVAQDATENKATIVTKTIENNFDIPRFTIAASMENRTENAKEATVEAKKLYVENKYRFQVAKGETAKLEKRVAVATSRDYAEHELAGASEQFLANVAELDYEALRKEHAEAWQMRWQKADVLISGDDSAQQGIRFNIFQLFATYYGEDARLNIGPKGFTGEKYGGATYWDTEAFALPLYLSLADKEVSRNLLQYRHDQLDGAKVNAGKIGMKGALYPMVTFTGIECHNEWEITFEEIHRNGAIAHAIYNYTNYTGDTTYLVNDGIDVLTEISRFWADRVHMSERLDKYMIHGVTGPNEYDNNVSNNWYTNYIATWTLRYTIESLQQIAPAKREELQITDAEIDHWQDIIDNMYFPYDEKWQIFVQHDTFLDKELRSTDTLTDADKPINQNWSWDKILRSCFIKQADVLQGIYTFGDEFDFETKQRNFEFYEPLTVHESSLSPAVHTVLAAEIGREDKAVELYNRTARLDLDNYNNDTEDGLHITSMAGSWIAIVQGFAGMRTFNGRLAFAPFLPKTWDKYAFKINYRDRLIEVTVTAKTVSIALLSGEALELDLFGEAVQLVDTLEKHDYHK